MAQPQVSASSVVLGLDAATIRLAVLGLYELRGTDENGEIMIEAPPEQERLFSKLRAAEHVLRERGYVRAAEKALQSPKSAETMPYAVADRKSSVQVRIEREDLQLAVRGLQAFLERENPSTESFGLRVGQVIDSPESIRLAMKPFKQALLYRERADALPSAEAALLS